MDRYAGTCPMARCQTRSPSSSFRSDIPMLVQMTRVDRTTVEWGSNESACEQGIRPTLAESAIGPHLDRDGPRSGLGPWRQCQNPDLWHSEECGRIVDVGVTALDIRSRQRGWIPTCIHVG